MKIFIHIGFGKTGTTSIQDMFLHNSETFSSIGLYYPKIGLYKSAHHLLSQLPKTKDYTSLIRSNLKNIKTNFLKNKYIKLIISSENLCFSTPELIDAYKEVFNGFDTKIIMYIRRQEDLIPSVYLEWMKNNWDYKKNICSFFYHTKQAYDFLLRINNWEKAFGRDNIIIRLYNKHLESDICKDFLKIIGIGKIATNLPKFNSNPSLSPAFANIIKIIDDIKINNDNRILLINELIKTGNYMPNIPTNSLINENLKKEIYKFYTKSNSELANRYLNEKIKSLFLQSEC